MFHPALANAAVAPRPILPTSVAAAATPISVNLADIDNLPPLELLAEVACRNAPIATMQRPEAPDARPGEAAFAEHLRRCNPPLSVALDWGRLPLSARGSSKATLVNMAEALGVLPNCGLVQTDGALSVRGEQVLGYELAAFDISGLPADRKHPGSVHAIATARKLDRHTLMRYVPARELRHDVSAGARDEAGRLAANLVLIRDVERAQPDFAESSLWKAVVEWCGNTDSARGQSDMLLFAFAHKVSWRDLRHHVTPAGDLTAHVLALLQPTPTPKTPQPLQAYVERARVTDAQRVALEWRERCMTGRKGPWKSLARFAVHNKVKPNSVTNYVTSKGKWKSRPALSPGVATQRAENDSARPMHLVEAAPEIEEGPVIEVTTENVATPGLPE